MTALTPCINVCVLDPVSGLCRGCGRKIDEIAAWATMNDGERSRIMSELPQRLVTLRAPANATG